MCKREHTEVNWGGTRVSDKGSMVPWGLTSISLEVVEKGARWKGNSSPVACLFFLLEDLEDDSISLAFGAHSPRTAFLFGTCKWEFGWSKCFIRKSENMSNCLWLGTLLVDLSSVVLSSIGWSDLHVKPGSSLFRLSARRASLIAFAWISLCFCLARSLVLL